MGNALRKCQEAFDSALPEDTTARDEAVEAWIYDAVELLLHGHDVKVKRLSHPEQSVTFERFAAAVDEFTTEHMASNSALGRLIIFALMRLGSTRDAAVDALGRPNPLTDLWGIADGLVRPLAGDALIALAEDDQI